jgi:hypothetical protein
MSNPPIPFIVRKLRGNPGKRAKRAYERGKDTLTTPAVSTISRTTGSSRRGRAMKRRWD